MRCVMEDKPGYALVQRYLKEIHAAWDAAHKGEVNDDLVCVLSEKNDAIFVKIGPRADYVAWLEQRGQSDGPIKVLQQPAGDVDPKLPHGMAIWVVVPTPTYIGIMRIIKEPALTGLGGMLN